MDDEQQLVVPTGQSEETGVDEMRMWMDGRVDAWRWTGV